MTFQESVFFIFAHQDDELGVFPMIEQAVFNHKRPVCVYLTSGSDNDPTKSRMRENESIAVLKKLNVERADIHFLGSNYKISDGQLIANLKLAANSLIDIIKEYENISALFVHAYEGGHQDHDAAFVIAAQCLKELSLEEIGKQFPMYRASDVSFVPYTVNKTLQRNGPAFVTSNSRLSAFKYFVLALNYRSQWKSMLGLLPFYLYHWIFSSGIKTQPIDLGLAHDRPHKGLLLYEKRTRFTYTQFESHVSEFLNPASDMPVTSSETGPQA